MSVTFNGDEQSLKDILKAREVRMLCQDFLLKKYRNTVLSYKLNIPGPVKHNNLIKKIFDEGLKTFIENLKRSSIDTIYEKAIYKNSGPEYFAVFNGSPHLIKELTTLIEETHPLGRIYDFDVLQPNGVQLSRQDIGMPARSCLICEKNAFECGRSRRHDIEILIAKIQSMALDYFKE